MVVMLGRSFVEVSWRTALQGRALPSYPLLLTWVQAGLGLRTKVNMFLSLLPIRQRNSWPELTLLLSSLRGGKRLFYRAGPLELVTVRWVWVQTPRTVLRLVCSVL